MPFRVFLLVSCFVTSCLLPQASVAEQTVRYPAGSSTGDFRYAYPVRVLQLALDKTAKEYGATRAIQAGRPMTTARIAAELEKGDLLDVATFPASRETEERLEPVRICIRKGILGIRLFLIDRSRQAEFSAIKDLAALKKLKPGQGQDWLDTKVLRGDGFDVVTGASYEGLFGMLLSRRFDYFPRGLYEPFIEVQQRGGEMPKLAVEESLALYYPYPDYFWVRKGNKQLAERLRKGLDAAIADGSFDKLFQSEFADAIRLAKLDQRRIFRINNAEYGAVPHAGDPKYWLIDQKDFGKAFANH